MRNVESSKINREKDMEELREVINHITEVLERLERIHSRRLYEELAEDEDDFRRSKFKDAIKLMENEDSIRATIDRKIELVNE